MSPMRDPAYHIKHHVGQQLLRDLNDAANLVDGAPLLPDVFKLMLEHNVSEFHWRAPEGVAVLRLP